MIERAAYVAVQRPLRLEAGLQGVDPAGLDLDTAQQHPSNDALHSHTTLILFRVKLWFIIYLNHPLELGDGLARIPCLGRWVVRTLKFIGATQYVRYIGLDHCQASYDNTMRLSVELTCERLHSDSAASSMRRVCTTCGFDMVYQSSSALVWCVLQR
jgi:hypothetical protein